MSLINIGLILTGGASRGAFEVGVVEYIKENHNISWISGTSVGAINGAVIASGTGIDALKESWIKLRSERIFNSGHGILFKGRHEGIKRIINPVLKVKKIENCKIPVMINAKNLITDEERVFLRGDIMSVVLASCSLYPIFPPVYIDGIPYVDNEVISEKIRGKCDKLVLVDLFNDRAFLRHPITFIAEGMIRRKMKERIKSIKQKKPLIRISIKSNIYPFDFMHTEELIAQGYKAAKKVFE